MDRESSLPTGNAPEWSVSDLSGALKRTIEDKLADPELSQMVFEGWTDPERDQLERNMSALRARIRQIPAEIERETAAIAPRYADPDPRMFPVAVTFLVPRKLANG